MCAQKIKSSMVHIIIHIEILHDKSTTCKNSFFINGRPSLSVTPVPVIVFTEQTPKFPKYYIDDR